MIEKLFTFIGTMFIWGKHKFKKCSNIEVEKRSTVCQGSKNTYDISKACVEWNPDSYFKLGNCKVCGCTRAKWFVPNSDCPLKKWK